MLLESATLSCSFSDETKNCTAMDVLKRFLKAAFHWQNALLLVKSRLLSRFAVDLVEIGKYEKMVTCQISNILDSQA